MIEKNAESGLLMCIGLGCIHGLSVKGAGYPLPDHFCNGWRYLCGKVPGDGRKMAGFIFILQCRCVAVADQLSDKRGNRRRRRMVFCDIGTVPDMERKFYTVVCRMVSLFFILPVGRWMVHWKKKLLARKERTVPSVSSSGRNLSDRIGWVEKRKSFRGSFTVEATMVMGIVLMSLIAAIRYGCILHDEVTGAMILEESLEEARFIPAENRKEELVVVEERGTRLGNPRIYLGEYTVEIKDGWGSISGEASAGDWKLEMKIPWFQPSEFLREYEALTVSGEGGEEDGS